MNNNKIIPYFLCTRLLLIVFILQFVVSLFIKKYGYVFNDLPVDYVYILLTQIVAVAIPCFLLCIGKGAGVKRTFRIKSIKWDAGLRCVVLGFCLQPVALLLNVPLQQLAPNSGAIVEPPSSGTDIMLMTLIICIVPALFEELLVRGMVLTSVRKKGYLYSMIVTSLLFALMHGDIYSVVGHMVLGFATAFAVLNTNSVFAGVIVHFSFNFCGVLIDYITNVFYMWGGFVGNFGFFVVLAIAGTILSCVVLYRLNNTRIKKYPSEDMFYNLCRAFLNIPVILIVIMYVLHNVM